MLLHGFGGTGRGWDAVIARLPGERYRPLAPDLPGHGDARALRPAGLAACAAHALSLAPARFVLCGYSMGGRVALHLALAAPERVTRLVLVSTTAGIDGADERTRRREADEQLAADLERMPFADWVERWRGQPLFAEDPPAVREAARTDQLRNDAAGLAAALREAGTGTMPPLWERLPELQMPAAVLAGSRDARYRSLAERLVGGLPRAELMIAEGGHALPHENPAAVAAAIG